MVKEMICNPLVIIPSYKQSVNNIVDFYLEYLDEALIINFDDFKKQANCYADGKMTCSYNYQNDNELKGVLALAHTEWIASEKKYDYIVINEHDVIPNERSLYACIDIFQKMIKNPSMQPKLASVSCVYRWNGFHCYPSHTNWWNDKFFIRPEVEHVGDVRQIYSQGVPFGFSIWNPEALVFSKMEELPKTWKLDSKSGEFLHAQGFSHLRLLDYSVQHINRGVNSWKK